MILLDHDVLQAIGDQLPVTGFRVTITPYQLAFMLTVIPYFHERYRWYEGDERVSDVTWDAVDAIVSEVFDNFLQAEIIP